MHFLLVYVTCLYKKVCEIHKIKIQNQYLTEFRILHPIGLSPSGYPMLTYI